MKKAILVIAVFLLAIPSLKADVVIEGIGTWVNNGNGVVYIECKNAHSDCIRISGPTCIVNFADGHQETYQVDGYEIISVTEESTEVMLYRH